MNQIAFPGKEFMTKRPTDTDPDILKLAAERALTRLQDLYPEDDLSADGETLELLIETLEGCSFDGYERARDWEHKGWTPDATLVEFLEDLSASDECRKAVKRWVVEHNITCPLPLNTKVRIVSRSEELTGEITAIHTATADVTVFVESLGHVREGMGTHGLIIAYEDLKEPV